MSTDGVKKIEEAARTADYKAMLYARKAVQSKPSYEIASDSEKSTMLENAMRETMEKRRRRGQDTMSKMAAYRAGTYRGDAGSHTRVPISAFLQDNGFVPSRPSRASQRGGRVASPSSPDLATQSHPPQSPFLETFKASETPGPSFDTMTSPEPMLSVERDTGPDSEALGRVRTEMGHLRTISQNAAAATANMRELELPNVHAEMGLTKGRVRELEVRVSQLEGRAHALENTSLSDVVERVTELEALVEDLRSKVGEGCDAEVAKMREVMGGLKCALDKVGGFV